VPRQLPLLLGGRGRLRLRGRGAVRRSRGRRLLPGVRRRALGGFEPLGFVPKGKLVVLGLVTTKRGELEDKDQLKRRIEDASRFVPLEQLCLSPQCDFSSTVEGNLLTHDEQVAKLRLIVETAKEVLGVARSAFLRPWV
jgi:methionine synthase II (cobalamin-independent)